MKPLYFPLCITLFLIACSSCSSKSDRQGTKDTKDNLVTKENKISSDNIDIIPPYGLDTVKALIAKAKADTTQDDETEAIDEKTFNSLPLEQKFTYVMIHQETYHQNCDILPERTEEAHRIYGHLPNFFDEGETGYEWSERQLKFLKDNRDSIEMLMKPLIEKNNTIGGNFEVAIVEMNAKELIPYLIDFYKKKKQDHDILTILMLLMKENKYPEFMNSTSYQKLYKDEDSYSAYLTYNQANEELIFQRAMRFYLSLVAQ